MINRLSINEDSFSPDPSTILLSPQTTFTMVHDLKHECHLVFASYPAPYAWLFQISRRAR